MTLKDNLPKIALGAWAWGNDGTFGNEHDIEDLKPIHDKSMELGLNLWDTAYVYGMGKSEEVLGEFLKTSNREDFVISTKVFEAFVFIPFKVFEIFFFFFFVISFSISVILFSSISS